MIHIRVPATSANMGPGFDSIGVALQLYNHLWVEEIPEGVEIEIRKEQPIAIPTDESNLIYQTMRKLYDAKGLKMPGVRLIQSDDIPMVRGLGSSAACIVGGLMAANELAGRPCTKEELAEMAAQMEGEKNMKHVRLELPDDLFFAIMVPDFPVSTERSRSVLPKDYSRSDVVFNVSRAALLVASLMTGKFENLEMAMEDKIHQPYRKELIPHMEDIFAKAKESGATACYLSGAGSTLMAMVTKDKAETFRNQMSAYFAALPNNWQLTLLKPDLEGAVVVTESQEEVE